VSGIFIVGLLSVAPLPDPEIGVKAGGFASRRFRRFAFVVKPVATY
jgi:hypothetical protein